MDRHRYDYLLVGAGLFNAVFAREASKQGKRCLVIEKRNHIGGNLYCENMEGINVHKYGAHIFHTNSKLVWDYMNELCEFNHYVNSPLAKYKDEIFNLPFNMNTFYRLWGLSDPQKVKEKIEEQRLKIENPSNVEEHALSLVGSDIYEKLIKGYTEKQWGQDAKSLPPFIIKRIPIRLTYDNNYFNDIYQGIPKGGYNSIFDKCFDGCNVYLNTDFFENKDVLKLAKKTVFCGMIDQYYQYRFGPLEYRSLYFEHRILDVNNYQGNAVVNYTEKEVPYTRVLEHKHFEFGSQARTVVTREYPQKWKRGLEPYYPVNTNENQDKYTKYKYLASNEEHISFGGRLGSYMYYDMDQVIQNSLKLFTMIND